MLLEKGDFMKQRPVKMKAIEIPEYDGLVFVRELSAYEYGAFITAVTDINPHTGISFVVPGRQISMLAFMALSDDAGRPMLDKEDFSRFIECTPASVMNTIYKAAHEMYSWKFNEGAK